MNTSKTETTHIYLEALASENDNTFKETNANGSKMIDVVER